MTEMDPRTTLNQLLKKRFKYYCILSRKEDSVEKHHALADALADDLTTNEWELLKSKLSYWEAQGLYGSTELYNILSRVNYRLKPKGFSYTDIFPVQDAIIHALLDTESIVRRSGGSEDTVQEVWQDENI